MTEPDRKKWRVFPSSPGGFDVYEEGPAPGRHVGWFETKADAARIVALHNNAKGGDAECTRPLTRIASNDVAGGPHSGGNGGGGPVAKHGIYVASKTKHAEQWRRLRDKFGHPIISTWIDEAGPGESADLADLWRRCISEAANAAVLVVYREPGEVMKGAFAEMGAALASGTPICAVGLAGEFTIAHADGIKHYLAMSDAMAAAGEIIRAAPVVPEPPAEVEWRVSEAMLTDQWLSSYASSGHLAKHVADLSCDLRDARAALARRSDPPKALPTPVIEKARRLLADYPEVAGLDDLVSALLAEHDAVVAQGGWRSIESAPHGEDVLLASYDQMQRRWALKVGPASWGWRTDAISNMSYDGHATHWMPLPAPPAAEHGGEG